MDNAREQDMYRFVSDLMARMTLAQKIGQLNNPNSQGADTTGAAGKVDVEERIRRGEVGMTCGESAAHRRRMQEIALTEGPNAIPLAFAIDVIHGYKTIFPIPLGLASSWDPELIERTARAAAAEASTEGVCITWAPMVDIARDARWGRVAEGAGEDPYLGAQIAAAMVRGFQGGDLSRPDTILATAKHFAGYGMVEAGRDYNTVDISAYKMHNVILPPFKAAVDAGTGCIMVAFNDISGVPATAHEEMLKGILRGMWNYDGLLATDYTAIMELVNHGVAADLKEAALMAARAGITTDLVSDAFALHLGALVREGRISEAEIDEACRRTLEMKYRLGLFDDPFRYFDEERRKDVVLCPEHRELAREAAAKSCVLLKNENNVLPLKKDGIRIALVGPLAGGEQAQANMQGTWAVSADPRDSVTVLDGLRAVVGPDAEIFYAKGANIVDDPDIAARIDVHNRANPTAGIDARTPEEMIAEAVAAAQRSDVIVACVGEAKEHTGESSTRSDIVIPGHQRQLLEALKTTGKPLVLVTMSGRPLALEWENANADAILHGWFAGTEAGNGIADILFGDREPSGRLTMSFPRSVGQCPMTYAAPATGRPREKVGIDVCGDQEKGPDGANVFRKFTTACIIEGPHTPLFPFGYGLSYTTFGYSPVQVSKADLAGPDDVLKATVTVKNMGGRAGTETVQLYIGDPVANMVRPVRELKGFQKVELQPGEEKQVSFDITTEDLKFYKARTLTDAPHIWEEGAFTIQIGANAESLQSAGVYWRKEPQPGAAPRPV